jgi:hypothetical protein
VLVQVVFSEATKQQGHLVDKVVTVIDATGLRVANFTGAWSAGGGRSPWF